MRYFWPTNKQGEIIGLAARLTFKQRRGVEELFDRALKGFKHFLKPGARGLCYGAGGFCISYHRHHIKDHIALNINTIP